MSYTADLILRVKNPDLIGKHRLIGAFAYQLRQALLHGATHFVIFPAYEVC